MEEPFRFIDSQISLVTIVVLVESKLDLFGPIVELCFHLVFEVLLVVLKDNRKDDRLHEEQ
jgi:hypothetical protein